MLPYTALLLLASCSLALASHFYLGILTFTPKGRNPDGSFRVDFRIKQTFDECYRWNSWHCYSGHCGYEDRFEVGEIDRSLRGVSYGIGQWCQTEALVTRNIPSNLPFEMWKTGCCWIYNSLSNGSPWRLMTHVDLGIRSDTGEPNRSPVTAILPFIRIPQNCHRVLNLLAHDPDMDQVRCRYGNASENECSSCYQHPGFYLDQNSCTLSHKQYSSQNVHIFEIVLEDYPRQQITLSYTDGSLSIKSPLVTRPKPPYYAQTAAPTTRWWWWNQPWTTSGPRWRNQPYSTPSPWWWNQPRTTSGPQWRNQPYSTPSPWWWNQPRTTSGPQWRNQPYSTPSPWWWNQPRTTSGPQWRNQPYSTPSPWWWNQPRTTSGPQWRNQPYSTPSPWWWNQPRTTSGPQWRNQPYSTPSPWWWNQPRTTSGPQWRTQPYSTPSPWWWNQPRTTSGPQWRNQPYSTPSPWWYTPPPNSPFLSTSTHTSGPHNQHWWAWLTTTKATTNQPAWHWQTPTTTTTHVPTPLSKIPLHFSIQVDPAVHSCIDGELLPQFLYPTPNNGEILSASVDQELEIELKASATQSRVHDFIISGPLNITKYITINGSVGESVIRWTPNENDFGDHVPICFIAESSSGSRIFHSQMRCIIAIVGQTYGKANVVCNETTMTAEVEKSSIIGLQEDHLRLNDPSCIPTSNSTHVIAVVSLNSCGTQMEEDADNLIFKNAIISHDKPNAAITRKHMVEIGFSCTYPKKGDVSLEFRTHRAPYIFTEKGFGEFTYQFEFFQTSLFNNMVDPKSYPIVVALGEMLFVDIKATSSVTNTELFVESCRATPVDDPNYYIYYDILRDGCTVDDTVVIYPSNTTDFKFGFQAFKFIGQHEEVFISCSVILCVAGGTPTRCSQGCINATAAPVLHHHHRRAVATETVRHYISQGPLHLKKTTDVKASDIGLNLNLAFIAVVFLLVVVILCGAVIYTTKRPKVKYQPLPSTDI